MTMNAFIVAMDRVGGTPCQKQGIFQRKRVHPTLYQCADAIESACRGPAGASFSNRAELEDILEEAFATPAGPLTEERKRVIAKKTGL